MFERLVDTTKTGLAQKSCYENALTILQAIQIWTHPKPHQHFHCIGVTGQEIWQQLQHSTRGSIFLSPHIGNWELITLWFAANNIAGISMYAPNSSSSIEDAMVHGRTRYGREVIKAEKTGLIKLVRALKKGHSCSMLPDQRPDPEVRLWRRFLANLCIP